MSWLDKVKDFIKNIFSFLTKHWKFTVPAFLALIGVGIWLVFFFFAFHLAFIDDKVDDDIFVFTSGVTVDMQDEETTPTSQAPTENNTTDPAPPADSGTDSPTATTAPNTPQVQQSAPANFISRSHGTSGQAFLITDGNETVLRIEDLDTDNGPDLDVYLVPFGGDAPASQYDDDFINLGDLKGNKGDQFYEIPVGTDLGKYRTIVIWCVRFNVAFGTVELNPLP